MEMVNQRDDDDGNDCDNDEDEGVIAITVVMFRDLRNLYCEKEERKSSDVISQMSDVKNSGRWQMEEKKVRPFSN